MSWRVKTSIRLKLTVLVALVVLVTAGALSLVSYLFARNVLRAQIHDRLSVVANDRQKLLLAYVQQQQERVALVASRTRLRQLVADRTAGRIAEEVFRAEMRRILSDARASGRGLLAIWLTDLTGRTIMAVDEKIVGQDFSSSPEFSEGRHAITLRLTHDEAGRDRALLAGPITSAEGQPVGVVMMEADAEPIMQLLADRTGLGQTGVVILGERVDDKIRYLLVPDAGTQSFEVPQSDSPAMSAATEGQHGFRQTRDWRGVPVLTAFRPVGYRNWGLETKMDVAEAYAPIAWLRVLFIAVEAGALLLGLFGSYLLARRFTQPIVRMGKMAESIATGGLRDARVVVEATDEIGRLGEAFNRMTHELAHSYALLEDRVKQRTAELQRVNETLRDEVAERVRAHELLNSLIENIPDMIFMKDAKNLRFVRFNKAGEELIGCKREEMIGRNDYDFFPKEEADFFTAKDREVLATGRILDIREEPIQTKHKGIRLLHTKKVPLLGHSGQPEYLLGISEDVTDLRRAEQELDRYFTMALDLFCIADYRGYFKRLNPAWEQVLGYSLADLQAKPFMEFVHPDDRVATQSEFERILGGARTLHFENRYRTRDGSYRWLQWSAQPVPDEQIILAVARDVTERKRAQELLTRFTDALNQKNLEMAEELKMAREIQQAFIPQRYPTFPRAATPETSALRFHHRFLPTSTLGGDFFDVFPLSDTEAGIFLCDVMGHGMRAALLTAVVRGLTNELRMFAADPGQFMTEINLALLKALRGVSTPIFASACYVVIDAATGRVQCANAGHPTPFRLRANGGPVERLIMAETVRGTALGLLAESRYGTGAETLDEGDAVLLYTDGLYEVVNRSGDEFGRERLQSAVQRHAKSSRAALPDAVLADVRTFAARGDFSDDVCIVGVEFLSRVAARSAGKKPADVPVTPP